MNGTLTLAREIEPLALAAWPARQTSELRGWWLRFTDGFSGRANSVAPLAFTGADLDGQIAAVEEAYRAHGLPPRFHVTPAAEPAELRAVLRARGYVPTRPSYVYVATTQDVCGRLGTAAIVLFCGAADRRFRALVTAGSRSEADGRERLDVLGRIAFPNVCALALANEDPVACGAGVRTRDWVSIYVMRTHPEHRRRGYAKEVLAAIADWAARQEVQNLFLQVEGDNAAARALYSSAGFVPAYEYCTYVRP